MSRIGKKEIPIPSGVDVKIAPEGVTVKGPKGTLSRKLHHSMKIESDGKSVKVIPVSSDLEIKRFHGLTRTLLANMVTGVSSGFSKSLTLVGVGYRVVASGKGVTLSIGYSHPVVFDPPEGIELKVANQTTLLVNGADKELVGLVAAKIRSFREPEPYHGKGIRYTDEVIVTKVGKGSKK